jgi:hypothetical protein
LLLVAAAPFAAPAQSSEPTVAVGLVDGTQRGFTIAELEQLPAESAPARLRDGPPVTVTGVSVTTLLRLTGLDLAANLGSAQVASHALIARAADGYRAVFGLAEVDPHFGHPPLLVSWEDADGGALPQRLGPFQLIATSESRPGRWVRQLVSLEVKSIP